MLPYQFENFRLPFLIFYPIFISFEGLLGNLLSNLFAAPARRGVILSAVSMWTWHLQESFYVRVVDEITSVLALASGKSVVCNFFFDNYRVKMI